MSRLPHLLWPWLCSHLLPAAPSQVSACSLWGSCVLLPEVAGGFAKEDKMFKPTGLCWHLHGERVSAGLPPHPLHPLLLESINPLAPQFTHLQTGTNDPGQSTAMRMVVFLFCRHSAPVPQNQ